MNIAIIPARGGSKRIPRKNIKDFCGKPMIAWSISVAQSSKLFSHIIVSTDDQEIASVAQQWGAEAPFLRPANLSDDFTGTTPVVSHAVSWCLEQGWNLGSVCCIYATAPLTQVEDLQKGFNLLQSSSDNEYVFSVTSFESPIQRAFWINDFGKTEMFYPECFNARSQDLKAGYHDAGQFYWAKPETWLGQKTIFEGGIPVILPHWRVQDIDTVEDWQRAEYMCKFLYKQD
jgi:pseudaminic acid cytidylyltransferase